MELLITVMTLVAALYAVVPRERQLDLLLHIGVLDWFFLALASAFVLYLEFNDFFSARGWVLARPWPQGITPQKSIYLVLVATALVFGLRVRFSSLSKRKTEQFRELAEQLFWDENYGQLFTIFERNLDALFRIALSDRWGRLRSKLRHISGRLTLQDLDEIVRLARNVQNNRAVRPPSKRWPDFLPGKRWIARKLLQIIPDNDSAQQSAQEILRGICFSRRFMKALVRTRPYLGLDIIRKWGKSYDRREFSHMFISELMKDTTSVLYQEIANNQNLVSSHRYRIPETNRILHFLLADADFSKENDLYKPVGDYALSYLKRLAADPKSDPYNRDLDGIPDPGAWESPLYASIRFFDIMVEEALYQGVQWHMWLYYFPLFVKSIVSNYTIVDSLADPNSEFPIRYSYVLYEIFSALRGWVLELEHVPLDQKNVILSSTRADHENGNIPKSAILALCESARYVLTAERLTSKFKNYLLNMVFDLYFELHSDDKLRDYATVLANALSQGGTYRPPDNQRYQRALIEAFEAEEREYFIKHRDEIVTHFKNLITQGVV